MLAVFSKEIERKITMSNISQKQRAPRNRTINLNDDEISVLKKRLIKINKPVLLKEIENKTIHQDIFEALDYLPDSFVDLVFVDPPYNLNKTFNATSFKEMKSEQYEERNMGKYGDTSNTVRNDLAWFLLIIIFSSNAS